MSRAQPDRVVRAARGVILLLLVAALGGLTGCTAVRSADGDDPSEQAPAVQLPDLADCPAPTGNPATGEQALPELSLPCMDEGGGQLTLGEAPGVPMVLNLWATWCTACRDELPLFSQLYGASDREQLLVAGVVTRDGARLAAEFAVDLGIDFPSGLDENGDLYVDQGLRGLPGTFFVDADGSIVHAELAPITSYEDLVALVREHLGVTV